MGQAVDAPPTAEEGTSSAVAGAAKPRIFISYSRKDMQFADRLEAALKARGFAPLIDRSEIYAFEDWWKRIEALIIRADTVVFVISPDAVASDVCGKEIAFAATLNKRFAPVVWRRVESVSVPEALSRLNFIFFDDARAFEQNVDNLAAALGTDIDWIRKHTEFGEQARRWSEAGRPGPRGLLLRSPMLEEAERWIAARPSAAPAPTEAVQAFIAESRRAAMQRRTILTASLGAGLVVALLLAGLALWQRGIAVENENRAVMGEEQARRNESQAKAQRDRALLTQSRFLADLANQSSDNRGTGVLLALEALPASPGERPYAPEAEAALFANRQELDEVLTLDGRAAFSPDGRRIVNWFQNFVHVRDAETGKEILVLTGDSERVISARYSVDGRRIVTGSKIGPARIWDAETGRQILILAEHSDGAAAFSPDGTRIITTSADKAHRIWDAETGRQIVVLQTRETAPFVYAWFSPDGRRVATDSSAAGADATVTVWNAESGTAELVVRGHARAAAFSPDGRRIVTAPGVSAADFTASIWDVETHRHILSLIGHNNEVWYADYSPDGRRVLTVSRDHTARVWDAETGNAVSILAGPSVRIDNAAFSPDGTRVLTWSEERGIGWVWETESGENLLTFRVPPRIQMAFFSPDGRRVMSFGSDNTARFWDISPRERSFALGGQVLTAAFAPDGQHLVVAVSDGTARILDVASGKQIAMLKKSSIESATFSSDGRHVVTPYLASPGKTGIWDAESAREIMVLAGHEGGVMSAAFSHDGRVVTASMDKTARIWNADTGQQVIVLKGHQNWVTYAAFSPDGHRVVTASSDDTARIWNADTGEELLTLVHVVGKTAEQGGVKTARFSPDGKWVVTTFWSTAHIWDAQTGQPVKILRNPELPASRSPDGRRFLLSLVTDAAFSPNGRRIVMASQDETARIWDVESGKETAVLKGHEGAVSSAAFSRDGTRVVTASQDGTVRIWSAFQTTEESVADARQATPRCLTRAERGRAYLDSEPPAWCIEMEKWPYEGRHWKDWLRFKRAGSNPPLPGTPEWASWIAAHNNPTPPQR
jgi:WD40 repeat protein